MAEPQKPVDKETDDDTAKLNLNPKSDKPAEPKATTPKKAPPSFGYGKADVSADVLGNFKDNYKIDKSRFLKLLTDRDPKLDEPPKDAKDALHREMGFVKASIKEAEKKKAKSYLYDEKGKPYPIFSTPYSEFSSLSPGITLYFMFLKSAAICFLLMSLLMIPAMYSNAIGSYLTDE